MDILKQRLAANAYVRIMIIDSTATSILEELPLRSSGHTGVEDWRARLRSVETDIRIVASAVTEYSKGQLEVGHLPYIPSFGIAMVDPYEPQGICYVELYHHRSTEANPAFELRASDDPFWFAFFREQYEMLWASCAVQRFAGTADSAKIGEDH